MVVGAVLCGSCLRTARGCHLCVVQHGCMERSASCGIAQLSSLHSVVWWLVQCCMAIVFAQHGVVVGAASHVGHPCITGGCRCVAVVFIHCRTAVVSACSRGCHGCTLELLSGIMAGFHVHGRSPMRIRCGQKKGGGRGRPSLSAVIGGGSAKERHIPSRTHKGPKGGFLCSPVHV
jgi:hypothetical protein